MLERIVVIIRGVSLARKLVPFGSEHTFAANLLERAAQTSNSRKQVNEPEPRPVISIRFGNTRLNRLTPSCRAPQCLEHQGRRITACLGDILVAARLPL